MTLLQSEGFGFSSTLADYVSYGIFTGCYGQIPSAYIGTSGPYGDNYLFVGGNNSGGYSPPHIIYSSTVTTFFTGRRFSFNGSTLGAFIRFQDQTGADQFSVLISNTTGQITIYRGNAQSGGVLIGSSAVGAVPITGWSYLEIGATISTTVGTVAVLVNNTSVLALTGVNNQATGLASVQGESVQSQGNNGGAWAMTHWYLCDNTGGSPGNYFLGDLRVVTMNPVSNDVVAFTPNGNLANYQNAAQSPPVPGTDYNSANTVGAQDTFNVGTLASGLSTVYGMTVKALLGKADAGSRYGCTVLKSGSTVGTGASTFISSTTGQLVATVYPVDPATSVAWTYSGANGAKPGYKVSA
jgi:hypothetical protein